jgi:hypothetical protein
VDIREAYGRVRKEIIYNILIEFGVVLKVVKLIKTRLKENYSNNHTGKYLSITVPIQSGLK